MKGYIRPGLEASLLGNPPKGQRNGRLYCLRILRYVRQRVFSDEHLWNLRIKELLHLIDLHDTIPKHILNFSYTEKSTSFCELAWTYAAQLEGTPDLMNPTTHGLLQQAEKYHELAITELRKIHQPNQLALQQRLGAQICVLRIRRLEQGLQQISGGTEPSVPEDQTEITGSISTGPTTLRQEIKALRTSGLSKIKETDQIYVESELHAPWLDGLVGMDHRQRISQHQKSFWTIDAAIDLLLIEQGEASEEAVAEAWTWVQKYKTRSLARKIGIRSDIPESILGPILASPVARPM